MMTATASPRKNDKNRCEESLGMVSRSEIISPGNGAWSSDPGKEEGVKPGVPAPRPGSLVKKNPKSPPCAFSIVSALSAWQGFVPCAIFYPIPDPDEISADTAVRIAAPEAGHSFNQPKRGHWRMIHEIDYKIIGHDMQAVVVTLDKGETVRAEAGAMLFMDDGIQMDSSTGGGLMAGLKRKIAGESFFITTFTCQTDRADVAFAAPYPGHIIPVDLAQIGPVLCQRDAYLCSAHGIEVTVAFTKRLGAGFFGGEGFILQKLVGREGLAFIHAGGTVFERELASGQQLKVDTGCLVAFQESVDYDISMASGIKTALFGGEGLFLAKLTGPGKVWLQTLPFSRMANRIYAAVGGSTGETKRSGGLGGLVGDFLGGND